MKVAGAACLVTGGARGLGRGYAEALLKLGAKVCVTDILTDVLHRTVDELGSQYGRQSIIGIVADVTSQQQMEAAFEQAVRDLGQLTIVINSAGIHGLSDPDRCHDINLRGVIRGTNLAVAHMRRDKGGCGGVIVNISSTLGVYCTGTLTHYHATKHGVLGYTRSLGLELDANVGISFRVLCPGPTETELLKQIVEVTGAGIKAALLPEGLGSEHQDLMPFEDVVKACMMCIERDDLGQAAVVKVIATGVFQVFPEKAPCVQLK